MKRTISIMTVLALMLVGCAAWAAPVRFTNGALELSATDLRGEPAQLALQSFHLLGANEDGSYLVYDGSGFYNVEAAALADAVAALGYVDALGGLDTLAKGTKSDEVAELQQGLMDLGYLTGSADGDYGNGTAAAVTAFQEAVGLEQTGQADEITRLLVRSMGQAPVELVAALDPEVMYAPILGRTDVDLQPIMDSGLILVYDDIEGRGFISDSAALQFDASGEADIDKYQLTVRFGLMVSENEQGRADIFPVARVSCLCVRRPVLTGMTVKAGAFRGTGEVEELKVSLSGVYTVEDGVVRLTDGMVDALAAAAEAGELKLRLEGQYNAFDLQADAAQMEALSRVGALAVELREQQG